MATSRFIELEKNFSSPSMRFYFHKYFYEDFITTHYRKMDLCIEWVGKLLSSQSQPVNGKFIIRLRDSFSKFRNSLNVY